MNRLIRFVLGICLITIAVPLSLAQENPYAEIPMSRTDDGGFVLGNPDAPVKMIEFADFLCPHCQDYQQIADLFIEEYVITGLAQFEYRMYPIVDPTRSVIAANLVECADTLQEGLFWQAHDIMFEIARTEPFADSSIPGFAEQLGLDEQELRDCAVEASQVVTDTAMGVELGITGTPSIAMQYGDSAPVLVSPPAPGRFEQVVNAQRPESFEPVIIEQGTYEGITTFRRADGGIVLGDPDAPVTVVAFEDFMCPHCQAYQETVHQFIDAYVKTGQAQFEYRFYPIVNPDFSMLVSEVAECVAQQDLGKFWDAHDLLYDLASTGEIDEEIATVIAMLVGVDAIQMETCVGHVIQPLIDLQLGQKLQVSGTPGVRARGEDGELDLIYLGQQVLDRGAVPIDILALLVEGSDDISIGEPEYNPLDPNFLADTSLISAEPCSAPCWQNIVPGETTIADAKTIIEQLANLTIGEESPNGFAFSTTNGPLCCQVITQDGVTVSTIFLQLAPDMNLGAVVEANGEPLYVNGEEFDDTTAIMSLLYPDSQSIVYAFVEGDDRQLTEDSPIFTVVYVTPDTMDFIISTNPFDDWKGYLPYDEYMDGVFDNNPQGN